MLVVEQRRGATIAISVKVLGITGQTHSRRYRKFGSMKVDQTGRSRKWTRKMSGSRVWWLTDRNI